MSLPLFMVIRRSTILAAALLLHSAVAGAQESVDGSKTTHSSSLGTKFVPVAGTMVLFATHETTLSEWEVFVREGKYPWTYKPHFEQGKDHPVVGVSLQDAQAFCAWLTDRDRASEKISVAQSYRLPTNSEWDAAAGLLRARKELLTVEERVADERTFLWGLAWPPPAKAANYADHEIPGYEDGFPFTAPVGSFTPTEDGLYDLAGNVWEWCWDMELRADQAGVLRGGSWAYFRQDSLVSAYRYAVPADMRMPTIGFRAVLDDKHRTATLLAAKDEETAKERAKQREQIMGNNQVDKAALEAMRKKLAGGGTDSSNLPNPADLTPAEAGKPFMNALGMEFNPLDGGSTLMGITEVRVQDFEAWLKVTNGTWDRKPSFLLGGTHPASGLSWEDAQAFCAWLTERDRAAKLIPANATYRLPTDTEWSQAAGLKDEPGADPAARSGANKTHFPWSAEGKFPPTSGAVNLDATKINGYNDSHAYTAPARSGEENARGLFGLGGNVAEWCADPWPGDADQRVIRGGSWLSSEKEQLYTSVRAHGAVTLTRPDLGFRCVLSLGGNL